MWQNIQMFFPGLQEDASCVPQLNDINTRVARLFSSLVLNVSVDLCLSFHFGSAMSWLLIDPTSRPKEAGTGSSPPTHDPTREKWLEDGWMEHQRLKE